MTCRKLFRARKPFDKYLKRAILGEEAPEGPTRYDLMVSLFLLDIALRQILSSVSMRCRMLTHSAWIFYFGNGETQAQLVIGKCMFYGDMCSIKGLSIGEYI